MKVFRDVIYGHRVVEIGPVRLWLRPIRAWRHFACGTRWNVFILAVGPLALNWFVADGHIRRSA